MQAIEALYRANVNLFCRDTGSKQGRPFFFFFFFYESLLMLFLENEAQIDRNNYYGMMLFMSKQVSLPKISLILQKMKIGENSIIYMPFLHEAL